MLKEKNDFYHSQNYFYTFFVEGDRSPTKSKEATPEEKMEEEEEISTEEAQMVVTVLLDRM